MDKKTLLAYYSFGEKLPVMIDSHTSKSSPAYYYSQIAKILENSTLDTEKALRPGNSDEEEIEEAKLKFFLKTFRTKLNNRQQAIVKEVNDNGLVTNKWCRGTFRVVNDTVNRDLNSMVELKILKREGKGRATRYIAGEKLLE
jgi:predicted HTH transcriptional regulator